MGDFETLPHKTTQNLKSKIMACPMPPKTPRPTPAPRVPSPLMTRIVNEAVDAQELNARITEIVADGTPLIEQAYYDDGTANENERIVTFLYQHATAEQVLIFVNRLTDEKNLPLSLMERIPGTDWWELSFQMRTDWRASYNFIPTLPGERPIWLGEDDQVTLRTALDSGEGDPLNPKTVCNRIGRCMGVVELADAPVHEFLLTQQELDSLPEPHWMSTADGHQYLLGRVGNPSPDSPLFILFDGEVWYGHGMEHMLNRAFAAGRIPDMNVFFLHSGGRERRWQELNGDSPIADYIVEEALPHLRRHHGLRPKPQDIIINGQSLGGLSSLLAVFSRPESFGAAIAQSSSLWQPQVFDKLSQLREANELHRLSHLHLEVEVGEQEWILLPPHQRFVQELESVDTHLNYTVFNGGHDYACWRGAIIPALNRILMPNP